MNISSVRKLAILGSTGSIGTQTLDVLRHLDGRVELVGLSAWGSALELFVEQVLEFQPGWVHLGDESKVDDLRNALKGRWSGKILTGSEGLVEFAATTDADTVLVATVGYTGLEPSLAAIEAGKHLALANKEVLVCGGHLVTAACQKYGAALLPVDSEHNAIFQCLGTSDPSDVRRMILTCSGGSHRDRSSEEILRATAAETLRHPTWDMGAKITVDSATLMNKGFEVIEAHHLFQISYDRIEVVIHPQSTIHSMVEFYDGSVIAQLGPTDMRLPIQHVLTHPERLHASVPPLDFSQLSSLTFSEPDLERFPCLSMAYEAGRAGGSMPCVLNAANEVAVALHLSDKITCGVIPQIIGAVLKQHVCEATPPLERLRELDRWAREAAQVAAMRYSLA